MSDNAKYWAERKKKLESQLENDERALMKKLSKDYDKALVKLEKEIGSYYSKYGKDNVIEYRKLLEQLSEEDKKLLYEKIDMFTLKHPEYSHLMPTRESIYKLNRLEGLQQEVYIRQCELGIISEKQIQEHTDEYILLAVAPQAYLIYKYSLLSALNVNIQDVSM